jgi:hypothetical protein
MEGFSLQRNVYSKIISLNSSNMVEEQHVSYVTKNLLNGLGRIGGSSELGYYGFQQLYFKLRDLFTPKRPRQVDRLPNSPLPKWWTSSSRTSFQPFPHS